MTSHCEPKGELPASKNEIVELAWRNAINHCRTEEKRDDLQSAVECLLRRRKPPVNESHGAAMLSYATKETARKRRRKEYAFVELGDEYTTDDTNIATLIQQKDLEQAVEKAINQLSVRSRVVIRMKYWEDLTLEAIAAAVGSPLTKVWEIEKEALDILRRILSSTSKCGPPRNSLKKSSVGQLSLFGEM